MPKPKGLAFIKIPIPFGQSIGRVYRHRRQHFQVEALPLHNEQHCAATPCVVGQE